MEALSMSRDGRRALCGYSHGRVAFWDLDRRECLHTLRGHEGAVRAVAMGPDDRWAQSGGRDRSVRLWDLTTGVCLRVFEGHAHEVVTVSFGRHGQWAQSGSQEAVRLWQLIRDYEFTAHPPPPP